MLLIGGALLGHGDDLESSTRTYLDVIRAASGERLEPPRPPREPPLQAQTPRVLKAPSRIRVERPPELSVQGRAQCRRGPCLQGGAPRRAGSGSSGERSRTDLRYFEIEPGGHSSLEKHLHAHIVIGARGRGVLVLGSRRETLAPMDVACIGPLEAHQLRNESSEPFGFFCIVDHDRDRPTAP